jgi:hypothetical protein
MTMLIDFDSVAEAQPKRRFTTAYESRAHLHNPGRWGWKELRDYVVTEIEARFGPMPNRNLHHEYGIFTRFVAPREKGGWGEQAKDIARFAFEVMDGRWRGRQVSIYHFSKNQDREFAEVIAARLKTLS